jgi:hypothetical protein
MNESFYRIRFVPLRVVNRSVPEHRRGGAYEIVERATGKLVQTEFSKEDAIKVARTLETKRLTSTTQTSLF